MKGPVLLKIVEINLCNAECNLAKIFRTPRDFDHLELVERAGFDRTEPTTTPPPPADKTKCNSIKKNGNNCANAHVSLRFGTDYGDSHIMKIPQPQPRHLLGHSITHHPDAIHNPNFFYPPPQPYRTPPPCPSHQYYHPYPPPVPYVFPNYYFWSPEQEAAYLPAQLNEYFMRHPDFVVARYPYNEEVFIGGRPVRRGQVGKVLIPADFVDAKMAPMKITQDLNVATNNLPAGLSPVHDIRSRLLAPRDSTQGADQDEAKETNETKRDCRSQQKDDDDIVIENTISMEFSDSFEESPYGKQDQKDPDDKSEVYNPKSSTEDDEKQTVDTSELEISAPNAQTVVGDLDVLNNKQLNDKPNNTEVISDLEQLLIESLVEYNCENNTAPPKMLVGYPITKRDDILTQDTEQIQLEASSSSNCEISKQSQLADDIDSLKSLKTKDIVDDETYQSCQCSNTSMNTRSTGKNFTKDVDELVSILIEITDTGVPSTPNPSYPDYSTLFPGVVSMTNPFVADDSSLYPDVISPFSSLLPTTIPQPTPLSTILNLILGSYASPYTHPSSVNSQIDYGTYLTQYNDYMSKIQSSLLGSAPSPSSGVYDSEPMISKDALLPTYLKIIPVTEEAKLATLSILPNLESRFNPEDVQDPYLLSMKPSIPRAIFEPRLQTTNFLRQRSNNLKNEDADGLKYISLLSRADIEPAPLEESDLVSAMSYSNIPVDLPLSPQPVSDYCGKCGHKHSGGNYCDKCGYPLVVYPSPTASYCPSCTREIRQLNDR